jgi:hypothetical protein
MIRVPNSISFIPVVSNTSVLLHCVSLYTFCFFYRLIKEIERLSLVMYLNPVPVNTSFIDLGLYGLKRETSFSWNLSFFLRRPHEKTTRDSDKVRECERPDVESSVRSPLFLFSSINETVTPSQCQWIFEDK